MNPILRPDELLARRARPELVQKPVDAICEAGDTLVVCAGFEERALHVLSAAVKSTPGLRVCLVDYRPSNPSNRAGEMQALCETHGCHLDRVVYDREIPDGAGNRIAEAVGDSQRIVVDIAAMSRLLIVQTLVALRMSFDRTVVVYTEAQQYSPSEKEFALERPDSDGVRSVDFISSGVYELTIVQELSTTAMEGAPLHLVAFPTFNPSQFAALKSELQAPSWTIIHGLPERRELRWRLDAIRLLNPVPQITQSTVVTTSTLDYRETLALLLDVYEKWNERARVVVAPTGSKMQAVAVGILRSQLDDLVVVYPTPRRLVTSRSEGVGVTHVLPLASFTE